MTGDPWSPEGGRSRRARRRHTLLLLEAGRMPSRSLALNNAQKGNLGRLWDRHAPVEELFVDGGSGDDFGGRGGGGGGRVWETTATRFYAGGTRF